MQLLSEMRVCLTVLGIIKFSRKDSVAVRSLRNNSYFRSEKVNFWTSAAEECGRFFSSYSGVGV